MRRALIAGVGAATLAAGAAFAADPVKIGMVTTLSTPAGYLGEEVRDAFRLAIKRGDGALGGVPVELIVEDDGLKPEKGIQIAERMMKRDRVPLMTGIIFSNVAEAVVPKVVRGGVIYVSPNAGPSSLAGKGCHPNYFNAAWQNDNLHEAMGEYATRNGIGSAYILAPNYRAGKDSLTGFKRFFKGDVVAEVYTKLGQTDYAAELAAIRDAAPESVFFFLPGGMGINFVKQYAQAGLMKTTKLLGPAFSFDDRGVKAIGEAAVGVINSAQWNWDLEVEESRAFVEAFEAEYGRRPTLYASQGYDTALLIGSALAATGGDVGDGDAFRAALTKADFPTVRGKFRFNTNRHPIQDVYVREVYKDAGGNVTNRIIGKAFTDHADAYAGECGS